MKIKKNLQTLFFYSIWLRNSDRIDYENLDFVNNFYKFGIIETK